MLFLTAPTETFTLVTAAALSTDWSVGYVDMDTTVGATAGSAQGNVSTPTTTTVVAAPAANVQRQLKSFTVVNKDATSTQTVTLNKVTGAGTFALGGARTVALAAGESLTYIDSVGFATFDSVGRLKVTNFGGIGASSATFARGDFTWSSTLVGPLTADRFIPASATVPTNGMYLPAANSVGFATNSTLAVEVDSSQNVIVGGTQAAAKLHVNANGTGSNVSSLAGTLLHLSQADSTVAGVLIDSFGQATRYGGRRAGGTAASKSAVLSGQVILGMDGYGYGATGYSSGIRGRFGINAAQDWTDSAQGTYLALFTTANGGTSTLERLRVDDSGQLLVQTVGKGLSIKEGSNAKQGTATLVAGTATVSNTSVTASSRIFLTIQSLGTVTVPKAIAVTATTAGTSFTITSADATDTSVVAYEIFEPS